MTDQITDAAIAGYLASPRGDPAERSPHYASSPLGDAWIAGYAHCDHARSTPAKASNGRGYSVHVTDAYGKRTYAITHPANGVPFATIKVIAA